MQPHRTINFFRVLVLGACVILETNAVCYHPNGAEHLSEREVPCNSAKGVHSMCRDLVETTKPGRCRSDGLCVPYGNELVWRGGCTDRTWKDPACISLCVDGVGANPQADKYES